MADTIPPALREHPASALLEEASALWALCAEGDLRIVWANRSLRRFLKAPGGELPADLCMPALIAEEHRQIFRDTIMLRATMLGVWQGELNLADWHGSQQRASLTVRRLPTTAEGGPQWSFEFVDKTPSVRLGDNPAIDDRDLLRELLAVVPESIYFKDRQSRFLRNSAYQVDKFGFERPADLLGKTDFDFFTIDHAGPAFSDEQRIMAEGKPMLNREEKETFPDGSVRWVSTSKFPLHDTRGEIIGTFGISRDITALKEAERARRELELQAALSNKLESIGRLAAGVAHEINTPTQFIQDNLTFVAKATTVLTQLIAEYRAALQTAPDNPQQAAALVRLKAKERDNRLDFFLAELPVTLEETLDGLSRVTRIVKSLKEFSHPNKSIKTNADLNKTLETTLAVSRHEWKYVAELVTELEEGLPAVPMIIDEINQVVLNLVVNAAQAITEARVAHPQRKGKITVRSYREGDSLAFEIADNGTGIPAHVAPHLFEPFFTTKEVGKGTGQGLAIIRTIVVKNHQGTITFETKENEGTTFKVTLPLLAPGQSSPQTPGRTP